MANGLAAFVAGMGTGYLKAKDKETERERQAKLDQITFDRADREKRDDQEAQDLKRELSVEAAQPKVVDTAAPPTDGMGPVRSADAANRYQVGETGYADQSAATNAATAAQKTPEQVNAAMAGVLRGRGQYERASALEASTKQAKLADFQLKDAENAHIDKETNRKYDDILSKSGNWQDGVSQILTETNVGGLEGTQVKPFLSRDGKTVEFKAYMPDGTEKTLGSFENNERGQLAVRQQIMKADPIQKLQWLKERADYQDGQKKEAKADERWNLTFQLQKDTADFNKKIAGANLSLKQMEMGFHKAREAREAARAEAEAKIPPAERAKIDMYSKEIDVLQKSITDAKAKGEWTADGANAKDLMAQLERAQDRHSATLAPFLSEKSTKAADPLGVRGAAEAAPAAPNATNGVKAPPPAPAPAAPAAAAGVKVLSKAGFTNPFMGQKEGQYNVQLPDGTTKVVTASELEKQGIPVESIGGIKQYSPSYK